MLNRFKQMIDAGTAPGPYKDNVIGNDVPETDYICRVYNNFWSVVTDTHMSMTEDGRRVVTGSFISKTETGCPNLHMFDRFICSHFWGACQFPYPFSQILYQNNLHVKYEVINGAECAVLYKEDPVNPEPMKSVGDNTVASSTNA